jgi:transposase
MLYLAIDQHRKHLTIDVRDQFGGCFLHRQVSTRPDLARAFFEEFGALSGNEGGYIACVEVCGFNRWLLELLQQSGCRSVILVQADRRDSRKTDRRDARRLSELLWLNAHRLAEGRRLEGIRSISIPTPAERDDRQLTSLRIQAGRELTRTINRVRAVLRRHNLEWSCLTKGIQTLSARAWLQKLPLEPVERLEMDHLLARWELQRRQMDELEEAIEQRATQNPNAGILRSVPGSAAYSALAVACRLGSIQRFPRPRSLANFQGLTPRSCNSGEATRRLGSITKEGSATVRFLLGQWTLHVLRRDARMREWFRGVKRRRGAKIARVAVMRRLTTILWHLLRKQEHYRVEPLEKKPTRQRAVAGARRPPSIQARR